MFCKRSSNPARHCGGSKATRRGGVLRRLDRYVPRRVYEHVPARVVATKGRQFFHETRQVERGRPVSWGCAGSRSNVRSFAGNSAYSITAYLSYLNGSSPSIGEGAGTSTTANSTTTRVPRNLIPATSGRCECPRPRFDRRAAVGLAACRAARFVAERSSVCGRSRHHRHARHRGQTSHQQCCRLALISHMHCTFRAIAQLSR